MACREKLERAGTCTSFLSSKTQPPILHLFRKIGYHAYVHPCKFLLAGILITILCSLGLLRITFESEGVRLWVPTDAEIMSNYDEVIDNFGEFETQCILLVSNKKKEEMVQPDKLDALFEQFLYVSNNLTVNYKKTEWFYEDICLRDYPSYPICEANEANMFALFFNVEENWQNQDDIDAAIATGEGQALSEFLLGGLVYDSTTELITNGKFMRIIWYLTSTTNDTIYEANREFMTKFQDYFDYDKFESDAFDDLGLEYSYFTSRSFEDEISRVVSADTAIYIATFATMFVYLAFTLGNFTCVGARSWLAVVTMLCMVMALLGGYGLGCLIGQEMNSVVLLIPYLLIGVGVDDEILIIEAVDRTPYPNGDLSRGAERYEHALEHVGLSISLTTFCSIVAFIVGTNVTMPGVASFCAFAAFCFFVNYVLQFLIFLPLFILDEKRQRANRNFCCWFIVHEDKGDDKPEETNNKTDEDANDALSKVKKVLSHVNVLGLMEYVVIPSLSKRIYRAIITGIFCAWFIISIISLRWLNVESDSSRLVPDDSYAIDYLDDLEGAFGKSSLNTLDIVLKNLDFSDREIRDDISSLITSLEEYDDNSLDSFAIGSVENWLYSFDDFINSTSNGTENINSITDSDEFYQKLQTFANTTEYAEWANEIIYGYDTKQDKKDNMPSFIKATRFFVDFSLPQSLRDQWPLRQDLKDLIEKEVGNNKGYAFFQQWPFAFFEYSIVGLTVRNIGSASAGVLFTLVFMMDLKMAFFIIIVVVMIDVELFGWMVVCDVALDSITFLQLIMAVGLTVDYVIHITHALVDAETENDDFAEKVEVAMKEMGVGVVKGAWTTFLGIFSLAFSSSVAFRGFFLVFAGIILIALTNGLFFVPALLGELTFLHYKIDHAIHGSPYQKSTEMDDKDKPDMIDLDQNVNEDTVDDNTATQTTDMNTINKQNTETETEEQYKE